LARRIAIVTSQDGAALRDILNVLDRRFSSANLLICPVPVQGASAAPEIAAMIERLSDGSMAEVMILARGGGSLEDLWAFNEEIVARAIFASGIPVISAVGHETDFTIADFVSDLRAPTPSAAAELVLPRREDLLARLTELKARSAASLLGLITEKKDRLGDVLSAKALKDPLFTFGLRFQKLDELEKSLSMLWKNLLQSKREEAGALVGKLDALGPLATLKRGFSVTLKDGKVLTRSNDLKTGDILRTKLHNGSFKSRITEVENGG
jgi:exodeoxyribonuclease VII large subunit